MAHPNPKATILEIQRMSTEDGPGIRTTLFYKGCTLRCLWCHNPESISPHPQVHWISNQCIGCKICLEVCPEGALTFTGDGNRIDRDLCTGCGLCAEECPGDALALLGKSWEVDDLFKEVIKDRAYFEQSSGGITLGGGEPTLQAPFNRLLLKKLKAAGIHTALDTCGMCSPEVLEGLLPYTDLLLFDLKEIDPGKHEKFTGIRNDRILKNLIRVGDHMRSNGHPTKLWIRTPIIPNATVTDENIRGIGKFIAENLSGLVKRWELCAFNNLCKDKYSRLDLTWAYRDCELFSKLRMEKMAAVARNSGVDPAMVFWSGSTKLEAGEVKAQS
ncbi:MAG: glycyl-radical enzyme activating protein [Deltaproteobacteria bacterium]|jgi:pyruvate formate lyase activating enzyme|nr:glycyl-radical enzyme activating protein [Deltaproteobacteria bacterium]